MSATTADSATKTKKQFLPFFIMGIFSVGLYTLLYFFSADIVTVAQDTNAGHKSLFFIPIVIAMVFSLAHGAFTSHFWEILGVKAKS